jgi:hypothetical protein
MLQTMHQKMLQRKSVFARRERKSFVKFAASVLFAVSLVCSFLPAIAQQPGQRTFTSPEDAARAFFAAMQAQNEQALLTILGPDGKDVLSSGDVVEDLNAKLGFAVKYQEMHRFVKEPNGTVTLVIGAENWPFPIPLVEANGSWYFDTPAGEDEILFRRIGKNEVAAIEACRDLVEAERQYFDRSRGDLSKQFAQKLVSDEGRHNGLYWHGAYNEFESPINPLIANADGNGPNNEGGDPVPYNGYLFRTLTNQGTHAPGGAKSYLVDGKMTGGFAFVAYPAEYRSSGVMTFIVNESGVVDEKDLGADTTKIAESMTTYDPDSTWRQADE